MGELLAKLLDELVDALQGLVAASIDVVHGAPHFVERLGVVLHHALQLPDAVAKHRDVLEGFRQRRGRRIRGDVGLMHHGSLRNGSHRGSRDHVGNVVGNVVPGDDGDGRRGLSGELHQSRGDSTARLLAILTVHAEVAAAPEEVATTITPLLQLHLARAPRHVAGITSRCHVGTVARARDALLGRLRLLGPLLGPTGVLTVGFAATSVERRARKRVLAGGVGAALDGAGFGRHAQRQRRRSHACQLLLQRSAPGSTPLRDDQVFPHLAVFLGARLGVEVGGGLGAAVDGAGPLRGLGRLGRLLASLAHADGTDGGRSQSLTVGRCTHVDGTAGNLLQQPLVSVEVQGNGVLVLLGSVGQFSPSRAVVFSDCLDTGDSTKRVLWCQRTFQKKGQGRPKGCPCMYQRLCLRPLLLHGAK